jgi:hypothetical protein
MGFHVSIPESETNVLKVLKSNPSAIFDMDRPYGGYLIFLIGGENAEELEWLKENVVTLDSMTGASVAFFIFSRKFPITLRVPWSRGPSRPKNTTEVALETFDEGSYDIERLVKGGRCGWVLDGDEISAISYAADQVAREFDVFTQLPCVIALDAIPSEDFLVHPLGGGNIRTFNKLLRHVIARFEGERGFKDFMDALGELADIRRKQDLLRSNLANFVAERPAVDVVQTLDAARPYYRELSKALEKGELRKSRRLCEEFARKFVPNQPATYMTPAIGETGAVLVKMRKTIGALSYYLDEVPWPLDHERKHSFGIVWNRHVVPLSAPPATNVVPSDREPVQEVHRILCSEQLRLIEQILARLPRLEELEASIIARNQERNQTIEREIADTEVMLRRCETLRQEATKALANSGRPSLKRAFARENALAKVGRVSTSLRVKFQAYVAKWFDPEVLIKAIPNALGG